MSQRTIQLSFFIGVTILLLILSFFVFKPYLGVIFLSGVLALVFYPLYKKFVKWLWGRESLAALATLLVILLIIITPAILIAGSVIKEAINLYNNIAFGDNAAKIGSYLNQSTSYFGQKFFNDPNIQININDYLRNTLDWIIGNFDSLFVAVFDGFFGFVLMFVSIYYLLKSGEYLKKNIKIWSPLPDSYDEEVLSMLYSSVDAVIRGRLLVSVAQGFFISIGFFIFGIDNPILWGFVGSIASLIPTLGTALITVPASGYLFLSSNVGAGIGMIIWGSLAVGLVDNVLSVVLLKRKIDINPIIILFSILGGVEFFGPVGLIAGPVLVSTFISFLHIYPFIIGRKEEL